MEISQVRRLPVEVVNQIAAGEVVERPAQLVKELLENSLDAEANEFTVDIWNGGRTVQVADNGVGISNSDLHLVLQPHTTSKIKEIEDLWRLGTFGFRGEALASISSVARLRLISRTGRTHSAYRIDSEFGQVSEVEEVNGSQGTSVFIQDLFENLPARMKFLKSSGAEIAAIRQVFKAVALANPQGTFRLRVEGGLKIFVPKVESKIERAKQVLEASHLYFAEDCIKNGTENGDEDYAISVAFSDPHSVVKTSKDLWIFAQGRWVQDRGVQAAIMEAYRGTLMHGEFPSAVVWLVVPKDEIDVNIHPSKAQVKFRDPARVFRLVHQAIRKELDSHLGVPSAQAINLGRRPEQVEGIGSSPRAGPLRFDSPDFDRTQYQQKELGQNFFAPPQSTPENFDSEVKSSANIEVKGSWTKLQVLAQAHLTYVIAQAGDDLVLVDQHAAHERVLFETVKRGWNEGLIHGQNLLFPLLIDLSIEKLEALQSVKSDFERLGIVYEQHGPATLGLSSIPELIKESALPFLIDKVATEIIEQGGTFSFERKLDDLAATMACHSAIRAGQSLSLEEMRALLEQMDQFSYSSFCPHGRPVSINWSRNKIEREFGRQG